MEWWQVYLFTRLDNISTLFEISSIIGFFILIAYLCTSFSYKGQLTFEAEDKEIRKKLQKKIPLVCFIYMIFPILTCLTPTEKEAAAIYLIPKITKSDAMLEAEKLPKNMAMLINKKCEEYINSSVGIKEEEVKEEKK